VCPGIGYTIVVVLPARREMHVTDLAINRLLGIRLASGDADHVVELCGTSALQNHLGTLHAVAQFALAEAASGEYLLSRLGPDYARVVGLLRRAEIKFSRPATGSLRAWARFESEGDAAAFSNLFDHGCARIMVRVEIKDRMGTLTMRGRHEWLVRIRPNGITV
jgi:acyl-coenzyme A thioesterase PaaI-like protein